MFHCFQRITQYYYGLKSRFGQWRYRMWYRYCDWKWRWSSRHVSDGIRLDASRGLSSQEIRENRFMEFDIGGSNNESILRFNREPISLFSVYYPKEHKSNITLSQSMHTSYFSSNTEV